MGRLTALPSRLSAPPPRIAARADSEGHVHGDASRSWYHLARWKHPDHGLRIRTFRRDRFTCQLCAKFEANPARLVGDHKEPHRGDPDLFWSDDNVWTLCQPCHDGVKQAAERRGARG